MPKYTDDEIRNMKKTIDHIQKVGHRQLLKETIRARFKWAGLL